MPLRVVWGITGSGDLMPETFAVMGALQESGSLDVTAVLSKAATRVVRWYKLEDQLRSIARTVLIEKDANSPFIVGKLQIGLYDCLLVAPATANTVAKIACGIADTIITNAVAQTAKTDTPVFILPVDQREGTTVTTRPGGEKLTLRIRRVDVENVGKLRTMEGIVVLAGVEDVAAALTERSRQLAGGA